MRSFIDLSLCVHIIYEIIQQQTKRKSGFVTELFNSVFLMMTGDQPTTHSYLLTDFFVCIENRRNVKYFRNFINLPKHNTDITYKSLLITLYCLDFFSILNGILIN